MLTVTANVLVNLDLERKHARFYDIKMGEEKTQQIPFLAKDSGGVRFGEVTSSSEDFSGRMVAETTETGTAWSLVVTSKPSAVGHISGKLEVELLEPERKTLVVFATAKARGDIKVLPDSLSIRRKPDEGEVDRTIRLQAEESTFELLGVSEPGGYLAIESEVVTEGKVILLHTKLSDKGQGEERFSTKIKVETSSGLQPVIEIPVHVMPHVTPKPKPVVQTKAEMVK